VYGNPGGLPELVIDNPEERIILTEVMGLNPELRPATQGRNNGIELPPLNVPGWLRLIRISHLPMVTACTRRDDVGTFGE
jgi:hypothetical protein